MSEKLALVTGASRGIGRAVLNELGRQGFIVVGTATTAAGAEKITSFISEQGYKGHGLALNVTEPEQITSAISQMTKEFGPVQVLVNNAGITRDNLMLRMKDDEWDQVIDTNLSSIFRVTKACLKGMMKARWGRIINIGSVVGAMGNPGQANYCAAKAGLVGVTKSMAQEFASRNITANVIAPGFIQTDMTDALGEEQQATLLEHIPAKRLGQPEDIAHMVAFLSSEQASYVTGQTLHVNGGMLMP
ncbi:3-oxoacyl-ACP reductase FabG [Piscirickettsia litoralis]|uniref:3-oxoacyl-[acyl-carrier-protein] reductase n=1 Tax=Piscirickettsia litoralis TaxID=1891921 RepID=A0ABX3A926_9GAMM|nr:3-oxoacyl-ACP reductase FabG [Piscirickettsia litoralis]ODN44090.1 3-oxoacyl-ACP reductase [Piscirickettsia litoralis]